MTETILTDPTNGAAGASTGTGMTGAAISGAAGGTIRWHSHPDVVFVTVTEGEMTLYDAGEPSCTPYVVHGGEAFVEPAGLVHVARNESATDRVSWYATHIGVPTGAATSIDQPDPGNCPF